MKHTGTIALSLALAALLASNGRTAMVDYEAELWPEVERETSWFGQVVQGHEEETKPNNPNSITYRAKDIQF